MSFLNVATKQLSKRGKERAKLEGAQKHGWAAGGEPALPNPTCSRMLWAGRGKG